MTRRRGSQPRFCFVNLEELVPRDHLLRRIDQAVDFSFIYDKVRHLYSEDNGRPSIDPVVLFKMTLIGYLYGIPSERRLEQEVRLNLAYRWFLGLEIDDPVPDHSTFSQNRRRRFHDAGLFQEIFDEIVRLCIERGWVSGELVLTDATHIKANAAEGKHDTVIRVTKTPSEYIKELDAAAEREAGRNRMDDGDRTPPQGGSEEPETEEVKVSAVDPDARYMNRPGKPKGYHYLSHQTLDAKHGIILDVHVTPGNVNDHEPYPERLRRIVETFGLSIQAAAMDRGYDAISVHRTLRKLGITGYIPRHIRRGRGHTFRVSDFEYIPEKDAYRCPGGKMLEFKGITTHQTPQRLYRANPQDCQACSLKARCLAARVKARQVTRPLFQDDAEWTYRQIGTAAFREAQRLRRIWCEGTHAIQKRCHNLSRARMRGRERVREQSLMSAIAVNLMRMVRGLRVQIA
ncbi:MAG: IS1182 family transposase [Bacillota bacterium]|nr:IS1182 family transposase [Bacillota bacterium]